MAEEPRCSSCGAQLAPEDRFCGSCGTEVPSRGLGGGRRFWGWWPALLGVAAAGVVAGVMMFSGGQESAAGVSVIGPDGSEGLAELAQDPASYPLSEIAGVQSVGPVVRIEVPGVGPAVVELPYDPSVVEVSEEAVTVYSFDAETGLWLPEPDAVVDTDADLVRVELSDPGPTPAASAGEGVIAAGLAGGGGWSRLVRWVEDTATPWTGRLMGIRADPPNCADDRPVPGWVDLINTNTSANAPLLVCGEGDGDELVLKVVNNRTYPMRLDGPVPLQLKYSGLPGSVTELMSFGLHYDAGPLVYLPPLSETQLRFADPGPSTIIEFEGRVDQWAVFLEVAFQTVRLVPGLEDITVMFEYFDCALGFVQGGLDTEASTEKSLSAAVRTSVSCLRALADRIKDEAAQEAAQVPLNKIATVIEGSRLAVTITEALADTSVEEQLTLFQVFTVLRSITTQPGSADGASVPVPSTTTTPANAKSVKLDDGVTIELKRVIDCRRSPESSDCESGSGLFPQNPPDFFLEVVVRNTSDAIASVYERSFALRDVRGAWIDRAGSWYIPAQSFTLANPIQDIFPGETKTLYLAFRDVEAGDEPATLIVFNDAHVIAAEIDLPDG